MTILRILVAALVAVAIAVSPSYAFHRELIQHQAYGVAGPPKEGLLAYFKASADPIDLSIRSAVCGTVTTGSEFLFTGLNGSETVLSSGGTAVPSVVAGKIVFTGGAGTIYDIRLSNGWIIPVSSGAGTKIYAYKSDGSNIVGTISVADINVFWNSNTQDEFFHDWDYGFTEWRSDGIELVDNISASLWEEYGNTLVEDIGQDEVRLTYVDNANGANIRFTNSVALSQDLEVGGTYLFSAYVKINSGSCTAVITNGIGYNPLFKTISNTNYVLIESFFTVPSAIAMYFRLSNFSAGEIFEIKDMSITRYPAGRVPANPYTGLSCLGQQLSTPKYSFKSVSWEFPYISELGSVNTALGDNILYSGVTPIVRSYWEWRKLAGVNVSSDGRINIAPTRIAIYSDTKDTNTFVKIQSYLKNLSLLGGLSGVIDLSSNRLTQNEVDDFLCYMAAASTGTGDFDISGGNAAPSAAGLDCLFTLVGNGWLVTVTN